MANAFEMVFRAVDKATAPIRKIHQATKGLSGGLLNIGKFAAKGLAGLAVAGVTALGAAMVGSVNSAIAFESAMADVNKVIDFESPEAFKKFSGDILDMSRHIPMAAESLAEISAAAAQAGVALEDNLRFTEFTAKSAVAFDMAAGASGEAFAKIRNVYKLSQDGLEGMADAVNHLSNNMAAKASQVIDFVNRAGGAAPLLGATANEMAAIGTALIAVGTAPETAARGITALATKIEVGGSKVTSAFKAIGVDYEKFKVQMKANPGEGLQKLFQEIGKSERGTEALKNLVGQDFVDDFAKLANNTQVLGDAFKHVGDQSKYAGSVQSEYDARAATTANNIELLQNNIRAIGIEIGSKILPSLNKGLGWIIEFMQNFDAETSEIGQAITAMADEIGDFINAFTSNFDGVIEAFSRVKTAVGETFEILGRIISRFTGEGETFGTAMGNLARGGLKLFLNVLEKMYKAVNFLLEGLDKLIEFAQSVDWNNILPDFSKFEMPSFSFWSDDDADADKAVKAVEKVKKATKAAAANFDVSDPAAIEKATRQLAQIEKQQKAISAAAAAVVGDVQGMVNRTNTILAGIDWTIHGQRMMDTLAAGMKARAHVVVEQIRATMQEVRNHLPSSPAKVGPLSDIHKLKFGETIAMSIKADPMVKAMRSAAAQTRAAANDNAFGVIARAEGLANKAPKSKSLLQASAQKQSAGSRNGGNNEGGGGVTVHYAPQITLKDGSADEVAKFQKLLREHSREIAKLVEKEDQRKKRRAHG